MEKKIFVNDIIDFVHKAIQKNLRIESSFGYITIQNDKKDINFIIGHNDNKQQVLVIRTTNSGKTYELELTEEEILKWKLLKIECYNYQNDIAIKEFYTFFDDEDSKPTTINDLDNEDD